MSEALNFASSLVGATIGAVGGIFLQHLLSTKSERQRGYETLIQKYLIQIQDAAESLWHRLYNLRRGGGRGLMSDQYYEVTTLYALGRILALNRIVVSEGVYASMERLRPGLGHKLKQILDLLDRRLNEMNHELNIQTPFYRYDRQLLAEALIEREGQNMQITTLLDFRKRYDDASSKMKIFLAPAIGFVLALDTSRLEEIMSYLSKISYLLAEETHIETSIVEPYIEKMSTTTKEDSEEQTKDRNQEINMRRLKVPSKDLARFLMQHGIDYEDLGGETRDDKIRELIVYSKRRNIIEDLEKFLTDYFSDPNSSPHPETYGILGRLYKDQWEESLKAGDRFAASVLLEKAIEVYLHGFEADWRDVYPGSNAVTLMEIKDPPDPRRNELLPVVKYALDRRIASGKPDYWDYAIRLELAVLKKDENLAKNALPAVLSSIREMWQLQVTLRNLKIIQEARERRGDITEWTNEIIQILERRSSF